jgi:hypothetical protein
MDNELHSGKVYWRLFSNMMPVILLFNRRLGGFSVPERRVEMQDTEYNLRQSPRYLIIHE